MIATIIKYLVIGIALYVCGRLAWQFFLKYQANRFNKAALTAVDKQIKSLIKKVGIADAKASEKIAELKQKEKNLKKLVELFEEKLENEN